MMMNLWWMCTAGGAPFLPAFGGGRVERLLRSTVLNSGRNPAGVAPGRKYEYASTCLSLRERWNSSTWTFADSLGWRGGSPESDRSSFLLFFLLGSEMLLSMPNSSLPRSPVASRDRISCGSVGLNMQNMTELLAPLIALITVSIDTRLPFGSGEKKTRTAALPTLIELDHAASFAVAATVGSFCSSFCRSA